MPTRAEQRVFAFLLLVGGAGLVARSISTHRFNRQVALAPRTAPSSTPETASWGARALSAQQHAVDSALQMKRLASGRTRQAGRSSRRRSRDSSASVRSPSVSAGRKGSGAAGNSTDYAGSVMPSVRQPVDINRATAEELEGLPRVGPALAQRIVARRTSHGPYSSLEDLRHVRGIGPATIRLVAPLVTFSGRHRPLHSEGRF